MVSELVPDCAIASPNDKFCSNSFPIKKKVALALYLSSSGNICFTLLVGPSSKVKAITFHLFLRVVLNLQIIESFLRS